MKRFARIIQQRQLKQMAKDYVFIFIGICLYSVGYCAFLLPEKIVMGGVTGISTLFYYSLGWNPAVMLWVINALLLAIAFRFISKEFTIRTIVGVTLLSLTIGVMQPIFEAHPIITAGEDKFMHVLIAGLLGGAGLGLAFVHNGSTGGTDIVVALISKFSRMSLGRALQLTDICIISSSYFLFHSAELIVYGICFVLVASFMIDYVVKGTHQTVQFLIISKRYEKIADAMNNNLHRGVTILHGEGWYSKSDVEVLMVLCRKYESQYVFNLIKAIDPNAMVSQTFCQGVFGEGFDKIR
ncbi:MAG: YitT family protein, partial [Bacteroidales bacterium]|nr:YitT family protein [Bacteroidales bacterium]